jgi:hypothetical protein
MIFLGSFGLLRTNSKPTRCLSSAARRFWLPCRTRRNPRGPLQRSTPSPRTRSSGSLPKVRGCPTSPRDGLFGWNSQFHQTHGFYIDGVDETTAKLPQGWQARAVKVGTEVAGRTVFGIAPAPEDLIASKLARMDDRDKKFVEAIHAQRSLDLDLVEQRIREINLDPAIEKRAVAYIRSLKP